MRIKGKLLLGGILATAGITSAGSFGELKNLLKDNNVEINLALTADYIYTANRQDVYNGTSNKPDKFGYNSYFGLFKTADANSPLGFGLAISNNDWAPTVGNEPLPSAGGQYTIDQAYIELLAGPVDILAGRILTNIGGEAPYTWQNINIQRGLVWAGEPVFYNGIRFSFTAEPFGFYVGVNDRDSDDGKFAAEAGVSGSWKELKLDWSFNILYPDSVDENDARVFNLTTNINAIENMPITFYVDYLNVPLTNGTKGAWGFALLADYQFNDKVSLGMRVERVIQENDVDVYGIGNGNDAWTITLTPKYQFNKYFYIRAEASYVSLDDATFLRKVKSDGTNSFTSTELRAGAEIGFVF